MVFAGANLISVTDVDAGTGNIQVNVTVTNGMFTLNPAANLTGVTVVGNGTVSVSMTGPLAHHQRRLERLHVHPDRQLQHRRHRCQTDVDADHQRQRQSPGTGGPKSDTDVMTITVNSVNDNPTAVNDFSAANPRLILQNSTNNVFDVLANDSFAPDVNETLTIAGKTNGALGTVTISPDGKTVSYAHTSANIGADSFTYTISDGRGGTATATVFVQVVDYVPSDVSGYVYFDADNDGKKDAGEWGIGGVRITLTGTDIQGKSGQSRRRGPTKRAGTCSTTCCPAAGPVRPNHVYADSAAAGQHGRRQGHDRRSGRHGGGERPV